MGRIIPYILWKIIQMFQTTNQITILVGSTLANSTILIGKTW